METVKNAANYVSDSVKQASSTASKEANKEVAKDNQAPLGTRYVFPSALCLALSL